DAGASLPDTTAMEQRLRALDTRSSAHEALDAVFTAWSVRTLGPREPADAGAFAGAAMRRGLEHLLVSSSGTLLRALDLPAVLELNVPGADGVRYATVVGLSTAGATFVVGDASIPVADGHPGPLTRILLYDVAGYPRPTLGSTGGGTS